jgi:hypothetical protein
MRVLGELPRRKNSILPSFDKKMWDKKMSGSVSGYFCRPSFCPSSSKFTMTWDAFLERGSTRKKWRND